MAESNALSSPWELALKRVAPGGEEKELGQVHLGQALELILILDAKSDDMDVVSVHVELQTGTQHTTLLDTESSPRERHTIRWEIKELGVHVLTCSATRGNIVLGRSFFKFNVAAPFTLKTRINPVKDTIYLSAQLGNASVETFHIKEIQFEPSEGYSAATLKTPSLERLSLDSSAVYYSHQFVLSPRCSHSYVFRLKALGINTPVLGRLGIRWETGSGDLGHLQTGSINLPSDHAVEVVDVSCKPSKQLRLHEPGELVFTMKNNTTRPVADLFVSLHPSASELIPIGESLTGQQSLAPGSSTVLRLPVIPATQGFFTDIEFIIGFTDEWVKQQNTRAFSFFVEFL